MTGGRKPSPHPPVSVRGVKLQRLAPLRTAQAAFAERPVRTALEALAPDAVFRLCHPIGTVTGAAAFYQAAYAPLLTAFPDLERRDFIVISGRDQAGADWIGCAGHYVGTFAAPWLDIPATGHFAHMRYHEFYRFDGTKVIEVQAVWDIPELLMQAGAWPLAPSLGREGLVPGPATQDGVRGVADPKAGAASCDLIIDMLAHMIRYPAEGGPEVMELDRFWHPRMTWYGPAGIGTARGIRGFRQHHQIPFLAAMPDRGRYENEITHHFFGDGPYAAVTGWPNMKQTLTGSGWLGIAPAGQPVTLCSLDFWRVEDGRIRENWVLVDLLDMYRQIGVDALARLREFNKTRPGFNPETGQSL